MADLPIPTAPELTVTVLDDTTVALTWSIGAFAEYYFIERKTVGGTYARIPNAIYTLTESTYADASAIASTEYIYKVTAYNAAGTAESNEPHATTMETPVSYGTFPASEFIAWQLGDQNPFRKLIIYTASGFVAKQIYAVVANKGTKKLSGRGDLNSMYDVEIIISNDSISGISNVTIKKDSVILASPEFGGNKNTYQVSGIISRTPMAWHLGLRP
jgi:hypothetical protein